MSFKFWVAVAFPSVVFSTVIFRPQERQIYPISLEKNLILLRKTMIRKRTCSFSSPPGSKAPRLSISHCVASSYINNTSEFTVNIPFGTPCMDMAHSQFLWPSPVIDLATLASDRDMRAEYKTQLQNQFECSEAFRQQFLKFVGQLIYEQGKQISCPFPTLPSLLLPTSSSDGLNVNTLGSSIPAPELKIPTVSRNSAFSRRSAGSTRLLPPRVRFSSPLSPHPPQTPLPGIERRPIPISRGREVPLRKQALCNTTYRRPQARKELNPRTTFRAIEPSFAGDKSEMNDVVMEVCDERLGKNWVIIPFEDWEMVDTPD
ncbi:hypothetical protein K439DRAFT_1658162 [Ramaria rubella]|nr:hypothetical protein K439DRAFT_1658162 [Ramaria rubella]